MCYNQIALQHSYQTTIDLGVLNIPQIRHYQICEFMYKYTFCLLPQAFDSFFASRTHTYNTRSDDDYSYSIMRTNIIKFTTSYQGPLLWNKLPLSLRQTNHRAYI